MGFARGFDGLKIDKQENHIAYNDEHHVYWNTLTGDHYLSVTQWIHQYQPTVDWEAIKKAIAKRDGKTVDEITQEWKQTNKEAIDYGTHYHAFEEDKIRGYKTFEYEGKDYPLIPRLPDTHLIPGVIPEALLYSDRLKLAGQADLILLTNKYVHVLDYKTNKKLDKYGFKSRETGETIKMLPPLGHLENCNFIHYTLQLSIYHAMIKSMRPELKIGNRRILHFEDTHQVPFLKDELFFMAQDRLRKLNEERL